MSNPDTTPGSGSGTGSGSSRAEANPSTGPTPDDDTPTGQFPADTPTHRRDDTEPSAPAPAPAPGRFVALSDRITSTANTPAPGAVGRHAAAESAGERGTLTIEDVVVGKVATAAAREVDGVGGAARRVLGIATGSDDGDHRPRVSARVTGQTAALEVRLTVAYPASVRATTEAVRAHIRDRVHALTELSVSRVDITVVALTSTKASTRRVVA